MFVAFSYINTVYFLLNLAIFNLPATCFEAQSLATWNFYEGDLSLYKSFHHLGGWQRPDVRVFLEKPFKSTRLANQSQSSPRNFSPPTTRRFLLRSFYDPGNNAVNTRNVSP